MKGKFIVLEGVDGSGKSTQVQMLSKHLQEKGYQVLQTKEPGAEQSQFCQLMRKNILHPKEKLNAITKLFLFLADRAHHTEQIIKPALKKGMVVISDRYSPSTYAYQIYTEKAAATKKFNQLNNLAQNNLVPDLIIWIKLSTEEARKRNITANKKDHFEKKKESYHLQVGKGFQYFFKEYSHQWASVNGDQKPDQVHQEIIKKLKKIKP